MATRTMLLTSVRSESCAIGMFATVARVPKILRLEWCSTHIHTYTIRSILQTFEFTTFANAYMQVIENLLQFFRRAKSQRKPNHVKNSCPEPEVCIAS